jgi:hypothetical protein
MKNILTFIFLFISLNLYSQCTGCNKSNQKLDIWDVNYECSQELENYNLCSNTKLLLSDIILNSDSNNSINEFGFQKWKNNELTFLALFDNRYKFNIQHLVKFKKLTHLLLKGIEINDNNFNNKILLNGEYILLVRNQLTIPLSQFVFSNNLKYISLDENHLTGEISQQFFNNTNLINLSIEYNELSGHLPFNLSGAKKLKFLTINNNKIKGAIPESICELTDLKVLHLQYNEFDKLPECICEMKKRLIDIELYGNKFCEEIPKCIEESIGFQECY